MLSKNRNPFKKPSNSKNWKWIWFPRKTYDKGWKMLCWVRKNNPLGH